MSQDPYPSERPDPHASGPSSDPPYGTGAYSDDPYVPRSEPATGPPAPLPARMPMQPPVPGAAPGPAPGPGMPPPYPYPAPQPANASAIVLTVLSGITIMTGYCCFIGIVPLVFGVLGIAQNSSEPEKAARMTKIGWIVFAVMTLLTILAVAGFIITMIATGAW